MGYDVASEMAFYGAYHSEFKNQIVHTLFVPLILWSAYVFFGLAVHRTVAFLFWVAYALFYVYLDPVVGSIASVFYLALWVSADRLVARTEKQGPKGVPSLTKQAAYAIAFLTHVSSWIFQVFVGHAMFEGRKPALLDSMTQAFSLAPLFVVYETIWMIFPGFQANLHHEVDAKIAVIHQTWKLQGK